MGDFTTIRYQRAIKRFQRQLQASKQRKSNIGPCAKKRRQLSATVLHLPVRVVKGQASKAMRTPLPSNNDGEIKDLSLPFRLGRGPSGLCCRGHQSLLFEITCRAVGCGLPCRAPNFDLLEFEKCGCSRGSRKDKTTGNSKRAPSCPSNASRKHTDWLPDLTCLRPAKFAEFNC